MSKIKIDPLLTGVDNNPQARLTIEQPVTQDVTLTYITNLTRTNSAFVRVEWSLNREWSVIAVTRRELRVRPGPSSSRSASSRSRHSISPDPG